MAANVGLGMADFADWHEQWQLRWARRQRPTASAVGASGFALFDLRSLDHRYRQAYIGICMRRVAVFIPEELLQGLKALKAEHGTPEAESIRRAISAYLAEKGVKSTTQKVERRPRKTK